MLTNATGQKPANLRIDGGDLHLHYGLIDPAFSENIEEALIFDDSRCPVNTEYPWNTANFVVANVEQVTVSDTVDSLDWSNWNTFPKYNFYNVISSQPVALIDPDSGCFNATDGPCTMIITFQLSPASVISQIRESKPGIDRVEIFLNEGAILGAMSYLAFFLNMYLF